MKDILILYFLVAFKRIIITGENCSNPAGIFPHDGIFFPVAVGAFFT